jgi:hypothetical protein
MTTGTPQALRGRLVACLAQSGGDQHQRLVRDLPLGLGFSTSPDFSGDITLIACFASAWTPAMVRRWHADPFGFLRAWGELAPCRHKRLDPAEGNTRMVALWLQASVP